MGDLSLWFVGTLPGTSSRYVTREPSMPYEALDTLATLARAALKGQLLSEVGKVTSA